MKIPLALRQAIAESDGRLRIRSPPDPHPLLAMPADTLAGQIVDTWRIHHRINLYLLDAVPPEALADTGPTKGRSVGKTFAHLHNV